MTRTVAVVPFGALAEGDDAARVGRWARQIARRLVDRFAGVEGLDLRPVFLVAMPQTTAQAGYLVFGSAPDAALAAEYGRSLEATEVVTGTLRATAGARSLDAALVDVASGRETARFAREIAPGDLPQVEALLARWLVDALGVSAEVDAAPAAGSEDAYAALLEGMDHEVDATLLEKSDPSGAERAIVEAATAYARAIRADPAAAAPEDKLLVIAAGAVEREDHRLLVPILEQVTDARPSSWRAHYMLGEMRRLSGDASGAIVALEHADALHPLRPQDSLVLAQLHIAQAAPAVATSRLRRIVRGEGDARVRATARRLLLGLRHPELERDLEEGGRIAVAGDLERAGDAEAAFQRVLAAEPEIWEAHFGLGLLAWQRGDGAAAEAHFQKAVEIDPGAAELLTEIGKPAEN